MGKLRAACAEVLTLDRRGLAVFRIGLATLLVIDVLTRAADLTAHYTNFGVLPIGPYVEQFANRLHWSLHLANGGAAWQGLMFALTLLAALCVLVGYRTRAATVVAWILVVSMHNRNPMILNGGDVLFRLLWFWAMFLPLATRWSVDAALSGTARPKDPRYFGGPAVALVGQIFCVYAATAALKTGKEWWPDGTASYYALSLDQFTTRFGRWMLQWYDLLRPSTYAVYALELAAPVLLLCPIYFTAVRTLTVTALIGMHLNFDLTMRLGIFPWVDIVGLLPLLPRPVWEALERRLKTAPRLGLTLYYDRDCAFCRKAVLILRELLLIPETRVRPAQDDPEIGRLTETERSWVVVDAAGARHLRFDALVVALEHAPVVGAVLRRLPLRALTFVGDPVYRRVARGRRRLGRVTAALLPYRNLPDPRPSWTGSCLALFFIGYVALWNIKTVPRLGIRILSPWDRLGPVLRLDQTWNMFAPYPLKDDGWYVIDGTLRDDTKVDLMQRTETPAAYDKPELVSAQHTNARWRKYMMNLNSKKKKDYRLYLGKYHCRAWNAGRTYDKQLLTFEIVFMKEKTRPFGEAQPVEKVVLWRHDCFKKDASGVPTPVPTPSADPPPSPTLMPGDDDAPDL